jgi:hypothetical protein
VRAFSLSCVVALVLACAADAAPRPVLTHTELVTSADAICERYGALLQRATGRSGPEHDASWLRLFRGQRRSLGRLRPNAGDAPAYRRFLDSLPLIEQSARALMSVRERGGSERASRQALRRFLLAHSASTRVARAAGLGRCPGA